MAELGRKSKSKRRPEKKQEGGVSPEVRRAGRSARARGRGRGLEKMLLGTCSVFVPPQLIIPSAHTFLGPIGSFSASPASEFWVVLCGCQRS